MAEIKLNEAALAAAKTFAVQEYNNKGPTMLGEGWVGWISENAIRAYLSADPDRAARDAVVEAAKEWEEAKRAYLCPPTIYPEICEARIRIMAAEPRLRAAVAALAKEGE